MVYWIMSPLVVQGGSPVCRSKYYDEGTALSNSQVEAEYNLGGRPSRTQITVDLATSFTFIIGIFFPSVTGD